MENFAHLVFARYIGRSPQHSQVWNGVLRGGGTGAAFPFGIGVEEIINLVLGGAGACVVVPPAACIARQPEHTLLPATPPLGISRPHPLLRLRDKRGSRAGYEGRPVLFVSHSSHYGSHSV